MKSGVWQRLDLLARNLSPFALSVLLVIAALVPLPVPALAPVVPSLAVIAVYYWVIYRPDLMPIWAVFLIGLVQDLLGGGIAGVGILALLAVHGFVATQRRFFAGASFLVIWCVFLVVAAAAFALMWLLNCALHGQIVEPRPAVYQYFLTVAAYPCVAWLFAQAQRAFLR